MPSPSAEPRTSRGQGTAAAIVRPDGATIGALTIATVWQAHSVRAVDSGLRKAGKPETTRFLDKRARDQDRQLRAGQRRSRNAPPPVPPVEAPSGPMPGALLVREHAGVLHTVAILKDGFAWQGTAYKSLSEIARLITGTRWTARASSASRPAGLGGEGGP